MIFLYAYIISLVYFWIIFGIIFKMNDFELTFFKHRIVYQIFVLWIIPFFNAIVATVIFVAFLCEKIKIKNFLISLFELIVKIH